MMVDLLNAHNARIVNAFAVITQDLAIVKEEMSKVRQRMEEQRWEVDIIKRSVFRNLGPSKT